MQRLLTIYAPKILILIETELWPNCLSVCKRNHIPVAIINGRLSPHSVRGYQWLGVVIKQMLDNVDLVCAQSERDGAHFIKLGLDPKRLAVHGNIKFDLILKEGIEEQGRALRKTWGNDRLVFIAASTHAGEEEQILTVFREIQTHVHDLLLIIVPRHPERFPAVAEMIGKNGFSYVQRSTADSPSEKTQVYLGDTMGELNLLYSASDVAFVGGSLVAIGGHNVLEPAALSVPVVVGPYMHNFVEITDILLRAKGLIQVADQQALITAVSYWLSHPQDRKKAGENAKAVVEMNRGAVNKTWDLIQSRFLSQLF
jgi:3-deoxy-D-manno-octulosonic-acid transferase